MTRPEELAESLQRLESRVAAAAVAAGRPRDELTVIAVTKFFPPSDVDHLAALGVRDFGESREQEFRLKVDARPDLSWHFIGQLQTNKAKPVAMRASLVHSLDRAQLVGPLAKGSRDRGESSLDDGPLRVLVQVSLDGDPTRGGALPADVMALADGAAASGLVVHGVMAVAPQSLDPAAAFTRLQELSGRLRREHPDASAISAGMSGDLEAAVAAGATHLRIGTALLGSRPLPGH